MINFFFLVIFFLIFEISLHHLNDYMYQILQIPNKHFSKKKKKFKHTQN